MIFVWLLLLLRLTGQRSLAQLSVIEVAIVIALGSAAGDPMFYPEVPLLHAMLVMGLVVGFQQALAWLIRRSERVEILIEDRASEVVRGGQIRFEELRRAKLSRDDLFESLRNQRVRQLGEVQRAYFEQSGQLSVFTYAGQAPPGLPIVPPWDLEPPQPLSTGALLTGPLACLNCGAVTSGPVPPTCPSCAEARGYVPAVIDPLAQEP